MRGQSSPFIRSSTHFDSYEGKPKEGMYVYVYLCWGGGSLLVLECLCDDEEEEDEGISGICPLVAV